MERTYTYRGYTIAHEQDFDEGGTSWLVCGADLLGRIVTSPAASRVAWRTVGGMQKGEAATLDAALDELEARQ